MRRGASRRRGERGSPRRCRHVPGDAGLGPARSLAASAGAGGTSPVTGDRQLPGHPQRERGGTTGNQNLQRCVAVTAAVLSSALVYEGKRYMCFVFVFSEAYNLPFSIREPVLLCSS